MSQNFLDNFVSEALSYGQFSEIEKLIDDEKGLASIPVLPLYIALKDKAIDELAQILPRLSKEQRELLLDLDLWNKDRFDPYAFETWPAVYLKTLNDDLTLEFLQSDAFALNLKSRCTISTFDEEEPIYPSHEYFFLTPDHLFLIEYDKSFSSASEIEDLLKKLYQYLGLEDAYAYLFKIVSDSYSIMEEEQYNAKRSRLLDIGLIDYFNALELDAPYTSESLIRKFIEGKRELTAHLDEFSKNQHVHKSSIISFKERTDSFNEEILKVSDPLRRDYLKFNLMRLLNASISLKGALKEGFSSISSATKWAKNFLDLGFEYTLQNATREQKEKGIFSFFDFLDLYKIGRTLIHIEKNKLKKTLEASEFSNEKNEAFLGNYFLEFIKETFDETPKFLSLKEKEGNSLSLVISSMELYSSWKEMILTFIELLPFISSFFKEYSKLISKGHIQSDYYLNYQVEEIDFENIIISSFISYDLKIERENKLGIRVVEFKDWISENLDSNTLTFKNEEVQKEKILNFVSQFGLSLVKNMEIIIFDLLKRNIEGVDYKTLKDVEFKHTSGPILLNEFGNN